MTVRFSGMKKLAATVAVLIILAAAGCGGSARLPAGQVIEKAQPAMQAVNTFHFSLDTSKLSKPMPGLFITKADGDVAKPDKLAGNLTATVSGMAVNVKVVVDGKSQYMTDVLSGKWGTMPPDFDVAQFFDPTRGVSDILANVKNPISDGNESIDGTDTYRVKGAVPTTALKSLSPEVSATGDLTTTLWIGSSDFLLRRVQLQGPLMTGEPSGIVRTINVSNYNKDVKIETPVVK